MDLVQRRTNVPGRRLDNQFVALEEHDDHRRRLHERAAALDDELQNALELRLARERAGDFRGGLEPVDRAFELGEVATRVRKPAAAKAGAPAAEPAASTGSAAPAEDEAVKAEPDAGDTTQTEDTVTDTEDVGPAAKASGGTSLFDTPADEEPEARQPPATTAGPAT